MAFPNTSWPTSVDTVITRTDGTSVVYAADFEYQDLQIRTVQIWLGETGDLIGEGVAGGGPSGAVSPEADGGTAFTIAAREDFTSGTLLSVGDNFDGTYSEKFSVEYNGQTYIDGNRVLTEDNGEIASISAKATPAPGDYILIEDSADSNNKKSITIGDLPAAAPAVHAPSHRSGGGDSIKLDDLAAPDDNTDLNASTGAHGLLPKLSGTSTEYLSGVGSWATPAGGGGTDVRGANIVIGNSANGDTSAVCDALDTGNGTLLKSTIEGASSGDLIFVRAGTYDLGAGPQTRITIPVGVRVIGAGRGATIIKAWTGADGRAVRITDGTLMDVTVEAPAPTVQTVAGDVVEVDTTFGRLHRVHVDFTGLWELVNPANVTIVSGFGFNSVDLDVQDCSSTGMSRGNDWQPFGSAAAAQQRGFNLDDCTGLVARCRTTLGYYGFYLVDGRNMTFHDLRAEGHWHRGLYANGCYYSSFSDLYMLQDFPPDFALPPSSHDGIEFYLDSEVRVNGVTAVCNPAFGGPAARYGISMVSAGKHIMTNILVLQTSTYTAGVNFDNSSDFNILTNALLKNGFSDAGVGNDVAHMIVQ